VSNRIKRLLDHASFNATLFSRIIADLRDERDQLNEAILALERMPFHGLLLGCLVFSCREPW
jgi:hypothetical protein